ncbi:hypothetical protein DSAG12_04610 [Promethearchaeum syntrophicum]|uniref:Uncharacterized protein n=1 Tax=Promethearchaeum syntrophicum TaxID=2594042 RepID=A0AC61ZU60_9ARCH|nr:hypothetical protein [Candidatus Prometheoarchaeum syntrophicum]
MKINNKNQPIEKIFMFWIIHDNIPQDIWVDVFHQLHARGRSLAW